MYYALLYLLAWLMHAVAAPSAVVLFDYSASETDELSVARGEKLHVRGLADGEDEWVTGHTDDGRSGLLPLSYVRILASGEEVRQPDATVAVTQLPSASAAVARAVAAAAAAASIPDDMGGDPELREAMRQYRQRRALYNGSPAQLERWGVRLDLEGNLENAAAAGSAALDDEFVSAGGGSGGAGSEPLEHRSGIGGIPFFNLVEYMDDEAELASEIVRSLRKEWLPQSTCPPPHLGALGAALARAAARGSVDGTFGVDAKDVILTFANRGYADFVLNGFSPDAVPNTLVSHPDPNPHPDCHSNAHWREVL